MSTLFDVDPDTFIDQAAHQPRTGRGAWTREGIGGDYRYHLRAGTKVGDEAEKSLAHWAVSAGVYALQERLEALGLLTGLPHAKRGVFTKRTRRAVRAFQRGATDPSSGRPLTADGTVGRSDARALWTPVIDRWAANQRIPDRWLRGKVAHESALDPGAVGYYIFYGTDLRFGGVDRGMAQINSKAQPQIGWVEAYQPWSAIEWSARRLRNTYDRFTTEYPERPDGMRWEAAVCAHNSPARAQTWMENGYPSAEAAAYVNAVRAARY